MSKAVELNTTTFRNEVLESPTPVLVDFWAEWCMPCRMLGPVIDEVAGDFEGKVKVVKVNVDTDKGLALNTASGVFRRSWCSKTARLWTGWWECSPSKKLKKG